METFIRGKEIQHLVVKLNENEKILGVVQSVLRMDDAIRFEIPYNQLFKQMKDNQPTLLEFSSSFVDVSKMIFSTTRNNKIYDFGSSKSGIFFSRQALLCTSKHLKTNESQYFYASGKGCLFLQGSGDIIKKPLTYEERYDLSCPNLFAYTCEHEEKQLKGPGYIWLRQ